MNEFPRFKGVARVGSGGGRPQTLVVVVVVDHGHFVEISALAEKFTDYKPMLPLQSWPT